MLTFLNSTIFIALPAIAIPLLIHLFNKQKKKRIEFSSTLFLKMLERQRLKRLKLYQYLLILVRTLLILFLVLAFARPTLTSKFSILGASAGTSAVIILDNSIHMHRYDKSGQRFKRAKRKTRELLNHFSSEDKIFIITSTNPYQLIEPSNTFENIECTYKNSNWKSCMTYASSLLNNNRNYNLELYIISDFQFKDKSFISNLNKHSGIKTYLLQISSGEVVNVSIDSMNIKSRIFEINKPILLDVLLSNTTQEEINDLELHLFLNDQRISHRSLDLKPLEKKIESLILKPKTYGSSSGFIEINDDDLLADNRYHFSIKIPKEIKVLIVDDNPSSYFKAALSSIQDNTNLRFTIERFSSWARQSFNDYDVILLANFSIIDNATQDRLKSFLMHGGTIFFIPGEHTNLAEMNKFISTLSLNLRFDGIIDTESKQDFYTIKRPNISHPLFSGLFIDKNPNFVKPKFFRYFKIKPNFKGEAILSFNTNDPFLLVNNSENGSVIFMTSNIEKKWTDLQFRGIFLPLLLRLFYLGASTSMSTKNNYRIGDEIILTLNQKFDDTEYYLESSDGDKHRVVPKYSASNIIFQIKQIEHPGNYKLLGENSHITTFSVNVNTKTLIPPYINIDTLAVNWVALEVFDEKENFETTIQKARYGHELWYYLIIFSFIMFLVEMLLVKRIEGKNTK